MKKSIVLFALILCFSGLIFAQKTDGDREMNQPFEPFKIIGNIYYIGASDVTSYLITTPKGHILIDSGFEETVPQIKANVAKLGFKLEDVKILLINHAHYDHCGGLAELKKLTGAKLYASPADAPVLEDGGKSDFRFGTDESFRFTPVKPDKILKDGEKISLGGAELKTFFTPGHTKGATSWTMDISEKDKKYKVVFASSVTTLDYVFLDNSKYPQIAEDFTKTFETLGKIKADVFLASHGVFFNLKNKAERLRNGAKANPFIDAKGFQKFVETMSKAFQDKLKAEKKGKKL